MKVKYEEKRIAKQEYIKNYWKAYLTFKFQRVFCPTKRKLMTLTPFPIEKVLNQKADLNF